MLSGVVQVTRLTHEEAPRAIWQAVAERVAGVWFEVWFEVWLGEVPLPDSAQPVEITPTEGLVKSKGSPHTGVPLREYPSKT